MLRKPLGGGHADQGQLDLGGPHTGYNELVVDEPAAGEAGQRKRELPLGPETKLGENPDQCCEVHELDMDVRLRCVAAFLRRDQHDPPVWLEVAEVAADQLDEFALWHVFGHVCQQQRVEPVPAGRSPRPRTRLG